jgi:hypothetical protein
MSDVTRILATIERGDVRAVDELFPLVYQELRQLAAVRLSKELPGQTLQATALVHEAYLRLVGAEEQNWSGRGHFFSAAAEAMRRILVENARRKRSLKYGGGRKRVDFDEAIPMKATTAIDRTPPVKYYFECTSDGSKSSEWQVYETYVACGLNPRTEYSFRVKARDCSPLKNQTGWSSIESATTNSVIRYVDKDAPEPTQNGTSWQYAFKYLQDALADANAGYEIRVAEGIYTPDSNSDEPNGTGERTATFQLKSSVVVKGSYAGYSEPEPNNQDINFYTSILSGDINQPTDVNDNSYHVVTGNGTDANAILDGFTITGGNANGDSGLTYSGGGIYTTGNQTVINCKFEYNKAKIYGGGMYNGGNTPKVTNCIFYNNTAYSPGQHPYGILLFCGGGMFNQNSSPEVTNCIFYNNNAGTGGGMHNSYNSTPIITNCIFSNNKKIEIGNVGDGIFNNGTSPTIINCTFYGNEGRGMYNSALIINPPPEGEPEPSNPTVTNCIFWHNGNEIYNTGTSTPIVTYSDIEGGYAGEGNKESDPCFVDANNIAGPDGIFGTYDDGLQIKSTSPCIDAANGNVAPLTDILDHIRVDINNVNNTGIGEPNYADMGAYEAPIGPKDIWEKFKVALAASDVNMAVSYFMEVSAENYRNFLEDVEAYLPQMASEMGEIIFIKQDEEMAHYDILREEDGEIYGYPVIFIMEDGQWKIYDF